MAARPLQKSKTLGELRRQVTKEALTQITPVAQAPTMREKNKTENLLSTFVRTLKQEVTGMVRKTVERKKMTQRVEELSRVLGAGRRGSTIVVAYRKVDNAPLALKVTAKANLSLREVEERRDLANVYRMCRHPHVVQLMDFFEDKVNFYTVLEMHSQMTLYEHIRKYRARFDLVRQQNLVRALGQTLEYMHANGVVLRALDPQGFLMTESAGVWDAQYAMPRLARLDLATVMNIDDEEYTRGCFGDLRFRAPEVLGNKPYTFKADVWSFGVLTYFILTGKLPFVLKEGKGLCDKCDKDERGNDDDDDEDAMSGDGDESAWSQSTDAACAALEKRIQSAKADLVPILQAGHPE